MNNPETAYYRLRLAAEQRAAAEATHPRAAACHRQLANHYAGLLAKGGPSGTA